MEPAAANGCCNCVVVIGEPARLKRSHRHFRFLAALAVPRSFTTATHTICQGYTWRARIDLTLMCPHSLFQPVCIVPTAVTFGTVGPRVSIGGVAARGMGVFDSGPKEKAVRAYPSYRFNCVLKNPSVRRAG